MTARILYYDCETSPIVAHVWGLRDLNVGINQVVADPHLLGVGYMWHGEKRAKYLSVNKLGRAELLAKTHALLDEADAVVGYNSVGYDNKWMNGEFAREGLTPPSRFQNIDLYRVVRNNFRWPSYKLQYASVALGMEGKLETGGHGLWVQVMAGDVAADNKMGRYCRRDVELLPPFLQKMLPWLPANVNLAMLGGKTGLVCPSCESDHLQRRGFAVTASRRYPRYQCQNCGRWSKGSRMEPGESAQIQGEAR